MTQLIRTEWLKIKKYRAFWWIIAIVALTYPGINYIFYYIYLDIVNESEAAELARLFLGNPFTFPEAFHTVAYFSSCIVFIPGFIIIMLITNEYSFKTHRQNIIDGWSRNQFMTSKLADVLIVTVFVTLIYFVVALIFGFTNSAWGDFRQVYYAGLFALQTFSQLSVAFFAGFILKRALFALAAFMFYFIIVENILVALLKVYSHDEGRFLPLEISDRLIPVPEFIGAIDESAYQRAIDSIGIHVLYAVLMTTLVWFTCYRINNRRDL